MHDSACSFWSGRAKSGGAFPTNPLTAIFAGADPGDATKTASEIGLVFIAKRHRHVEQRSVRSRQNFGCHFETCGFDQVRKAGSRVLEFALQRPWTDFQNFREHGHLGGPFTKVRADQTFEIFHPVQCLRDERVRHVCRRAGQFAGRKN